MLLLWRRRIGRSGGCFSFAGVAGCSGGGGGLARGLLLRWLLYGLGRGWVCGGHGVVAQTHGGDGVRGESVGWLLLDGLLLGLLLVVGVLQHGAAGGVRVLWLVWPDARRRSFVALRTGEDGGRGASLSQKRPSC